MPQLKLARALGIFAFVAEGFFATLWALFGLAAHLNYLNYPAWELALRSTILVAGPAATLIGIFVVMRRPRLGGVLFLAAAACLMGMATQSKTGEGRFRPIDAIFLLLYFGPGLAAGTLALAVANRYHPRHDTNPGR